jgi:predicted ArsR family transcriptional regulator
MPLPHASEDRVLYLLKSRGAQTAGIVAERLGMTSVGARKHLLRLDEKGLVQSEDQREAVGRPKRYWSLTERGHARFPDAHSHLTLELLQSLRKVFGESGIERIIAERERETETAYRKALQGCRDLKSRVRRLATLREQEGYMAEWKRNRDGSFLLIENHCPICAAAKECQGLCRSELSIFQAAFGDDVTITRVDHILAGARRCAYLIAPLDA